MFPNTLYYFTPVGLYRTKISSTDFEEITTNGRSGREGIPHQVLFPGVMFPRRSDTPAPSISRAHPLREHQHWQVVSKHKHTHAHTDSYRCSGAARGSILRGASGPVRGHARCLHRSMSARTHTHAPRDQPVRPLWTPLLNNWRVSGIVEIRSLQGSTVYVEEGFHRRFTSFCFLGTVVVKSSILRL